MRNTLEVYIRRMSLVRFGTLTWTYDGWQGKVYKKTYMKTAFAWAFRRILPTPTTGGRFTLGNVRLTVHALIGILTGT